jgi:hypothetical protein
MGDARVLADADQGDPVGRHPEATEGGQDLGELELAVQVGLEPQQVAAVAAGGQGPVAVLEPAPGLVAVDPVQAGQEPGPGPAQPVGVQPLGHRALVQDVGPDQGVAGQPGPAQQVGGAVAVGDVEGAGAHGRPV